MQTRRARAPPFIRREAPVRTDQAKIDAGRKREHHVESGEYIRRRAREKWVLYSHLDPGAGVRRASWDGRRGGFVQRRGEKRNHRVDRWACRLLFVFSHW